jgi:hypothetical protein
LWTSIWGCGSPAASCCCRFYLCRSQEWGLHSPCPAGYVCSEFSWPHALFFSPVYSPTCLLQLQSVFLLFRVHLGMCLSSTLQRSEPHFSCYYRPYPLQAYWGRCCHSCLLPPACLFTVCVKE